jgi:hypothetical protein
MWTPPRLFVILVSRRLVSYTKTTYMDASKLSAFNSTNIHASKRLCNFADMDASQTAHNVAYEGVSKSFRTGRLERELQMV